MHHLNWDIACTWHSPLAPQFLEWMDRNNLTILNDPVQHTFCSRDNTARSVIDIIMVNDLLAALDCIHHFSVDWDRCWTSDHAGFFWTVVFAPPQVPDPLGIKWNFKHADPAEWKAAYAKAVKAHAPTFDRLQTANPCTDMLIEAAATALDRAFQETTQATVNEHRPSRHSQPWWTPELTTAL